MRLHANCSRRTLGLIFRVQRECMCPKLVKDGSQARLAILWRKEKWKAMMSELGKDAKIPALWIMAALLETFTKDVREQAKMRLDESGDYLRRRWCPIRLARPSKHEGVSGSESQKRKVGEMWTRFEEGQCVAIAR